MRMRIRLRHTDLGATHVCARLGRREHERGAYVFGGLTGATNDSRTSDERSEPLTFPCSISLADANPFRESPAATAAEEAFDAFVEGALRDGMLSEAELDLLTDELATRAPKLRTACMLRLLEPLLLPGTVVMMAGLESRPELNGERGVLLAYRPSKPGRTKSVWRTGAGTRLLILHHSNGDCLIIEYPVHN